MSNMLTPFEQLKALDTRYRKIAVGLPSPQLASQNWSGIGFRLGEQRYVAALGEVAEILREPRYTPLPGVKVWVRGIANLRGRLLPVIDLCRYFGVQSVAASKRRTVLVLECGEIFAGLIVDELFGMQHFAPEAFAQQAPQVNPLIQPCLAGAFRQEQFWPVFSPHQLAKHPNFMQVTL